MTKITNSTVLNTKVIAAKILEWFEAQNFDLKISNLGSDYYITARKSNAIRIAISADHALIVGIHSGDFGTIIEIKQGSWETKILTNAVWLALTGGTNLLLSGWSFILQKDLENHIEKIILNSAEVRDLHCQIPDPRPGNFKPGSYIPEKPITNAIESTVSAMSKIGRDITNSASNLIDNIGKKKNQHFCTNCGEKKSRDANFCPKCGTPYV